MSTFFRICLFVLGIFVFGAAFISPKEYGFTTEKFWLGLISTWMLDLLADVRDMGNRIEALHKRYMK